MSFEARLRSHLESLGAEGSAPARTRRLDVGAMRRHLLERLRRLLADGGRDARTIRRLHTQWTDRLPRLAAHIENLPTDEAPTDAHAANNLALAVIDEAVLLDIDAPLTVERLEAQRVLGRIQVGDLERYALENHLTATGPNAGHPALTPVGRTFLHLRGRDAVRWLLTAEVVQNLGPLDVWRIPIELLHWFLEEGVELDAIDAATWPYTEEALDRMFSMGLCTRDTSRPFFEMRFVAVPAMRDLIAAVVEAGPWHAAVRAMLEDERAAAVPALAGATSAVDATIEQTRLITHEVRNALVPVRGTLDAVLTTAGLPARERIERARTGVVRVLTFVDQLVATTEMIAEPATVSLLGEVAREAIEHVEDGDRVTVVAPEGAVAVLAPRSRLVMTLGNVIRNALQSAPSPADVRISWQRVDESVHVVVDDAGPGVPVRDRARVFDEGFTTRPGGSGFGLAFARKFVEGTLRGTIRCDDSDLGGARFVIIIPTVPSP